MPLLTVAAVDDAVAVAPPEVAGSVYLSLCEDEVGCVISVVCSATVDGEETVVVPLGCLSEHDVRATTAEIVNERIISVARNLFFISYTSINQ